MTWGINNWKEGPNPYFCKYLSEAQENSEMSQGVTVIISMSGFKSKLLCYSYRKKKPICQGLILLGTEMLSLNRRCEKISEIDSSHFIVFLCRSTCWTSKRQNHDWILWLLGAFIDFVSRCKLTALKLKQKEKTKVHRNLVYQGNILDSLRKIYFMTKGIVGGQWYDGRRGLFSCHCWDVRPEFMAMEPGGEWDESMPQVRDEECRLPFATFSIIDLAPGRRNSDICGHWRATFPKKMPPHFPDMLPDVSIIMSVSCSCSRPGHLSYLALSVNLSVPVS